MVADARYDFDSPELDGTTGFIQWKGTDICIDFTCECGWLGHFDGYFCYTVRCGGCKRVWALPHTVRLIPENEFNREYHTPVDPDGDDDVAEVPEGTLAHIAEVERCVRQMGKKAK